MLYDPRPLYFTGYPTQRASNIEFALKAEGSPIEATELLGP